MNQSNDDNCENDGQNRESDTISNGDIHRFVHSLSPDARKTIRTQAYRWRQLRDTDAPPPGLRFRRWTFVYLAAFTASIAGACVTLGTWRIEWVLLWSLMCMAVAFFALIRMTNWIVPNYIRLHTERGIIQQCPQCEYDQRGTVNDTCPECGCPVRVSWTSTTT